MPKHKPVIEVSPEELEQAAGGSTPLWSTVNVGLSPSHNYGIISDTYGRGMQYSDANTLLQQYNAPTAAALYGDGNSPDATTGIVSRPGAGNIAGTGWDWGGKVTLEHGDGWVRNTTVPGEHPLEGSASRHLVIDLHEGGGYQTMTIGQGKDGAQLAQTIGGTVAGPLGALAAQNGAHVLNPGLADNSFGLLDRAMISKAEGTPNPNLTAPQGLPTEAGGLFSSVVEGAKVIAGYGPALPANAPAQDKMISDLGRQLAEAGPVEGKFMKSGELPGIYHTTDKGTTYYEREGDKMVSKQLDDFAGADKAIEREAAREAARQEATERPQPDAPADTPAPAPEYPVSEPGVRAQEAPTETPAPEYPVSEPGVRAQEAPTETPAPEYPVSEPGVRAQEAPTETPAPEYPVSEPGVRAQEAPTELPDAVNSAPLSYETPINTPDTLGGIGGGNELGTIGQPYSDPYNSSTEYSNALYDSSTPFQSWDSSSALTYPSETSLGYQGLDGGAASSSLSYDSYNADNFSGTSFDTSSSGFDSGYSSGFDSSGFDSGYTGGGYDSGGGGGGGGASGGGGE